MYIEKVTLKNIRCFDKIIIPFNKLGDSKLFLGDNGDGKSTILRSIAMGICDESSAAALFRELPGEYVRRNKKTKIVKEGAFGDIEVDLNAGYGNTYRIQTRITSLKTFERVTQELYIIKDNKKEIIKQDKFPWGKIFISSYGPGLRTIGNMDYQHYLPVDAVYPLFNYSSSLQNPELIIRRLIDTAGDKAKNSNEKEEQKKLVLGKIQALMAVLLDLKDPKNFKLTPTGIEVEGPWGTAELHELGDGFQATITWVIDLLSWWFLGRKKTANWDLSSIKGIVLIDEIEQHLHPRWQRRIIPRLREKFPSIQFIITSHSPLVASSSRDVDVHLLSKGKPRTIHPHGWLAEDMYDEMGLSSSRSIDFEEYISRYKKLSFKNFNNALSSKEKKDYLSLKDIFRKMPESDPISLSLEIQSITENLKSLKRNNK